MNLEDDTELDRIPAGADFTEDGAADDEPGLLPELVGAVTCITPTLDAVSTQEKALREGRVEVTQNGKVLCQGPSLSFSQACPEHV